MLAGVVLRNLSRNRLAEISGGDPERMTETLVAALDALARHFEIGRERHAA